MTVSPSGDQHIHEFDETVKGWFGAYDKLSMALTFLHEQFGQEVQRIQDIAPGAPSCEPGPPTFGHHVTTG